MGEVAEMILDGTLCQSCGVFIGEGEGFPRECAYCRRAGKAAGKIACPVCKKKVKGLNDHIRDAHPGHAEREKAAQETATRDMLDSARSDLDLIREALGVPVEPHQSLLERMVEAAQSKRGAVPDGWQVVPKVASDAMLRPFYECPPEELQLAWQAAVLIAKTQAKREAALQKIVSESERLGLYDASAAPAPDNFRDAAGMVPVHCTPTEHEGRIVYEHTSEPIPNADGFVLYAASADQFRTAAKMMAVQPACMTCSGHGMVGGLLPNGGGYQADPCPDCAAPAAAEVPMPAKCDGNHAGPPCADPECWNDDAPIENGDDDWSGDDMMGASS